MTKDLQGIPDAMLTPAQKELAKAQRTSNNLAQRLRAIQDRLTALGFQDLQLAWAPDAAKGEDLAALLEAYLDGQTDPMPPVGDSVRHGTSKQRVSISVEGSELMMELFNRMPIESLKAVPEHIRKRIGQFMVDNGYRFVFDRWFLQADPKAPERSADETTGKQPDWEAEYKKLAGVYSRTGLEEFIAKHWPGNKLVDVAALDEAYDLLTCARPAEHLEDATPDDWYAQRAAWYSRNPGGQSSPHEPRETSDDEELNNVIADVREILDEFDSEDVRVMARRAVETIFSLRDSLRWLAESADPNKLTGLFVVTHARRALGMQPEEPVCNHEWVMDSDCDHHCTRWPSWR